MPGTEIRGGDGFTTGGHGYRCTGYMRFRDWRDEPYGPPTRVHVLLEEILGPRRPSTIWCRREEAEFVCGYGVCGCIVAAEGLRSEGPVAWSEPDLERARHDAERWAGKPTEIGFENDYYLLVKLCEAAWPGAKA